MRSLTSSRTRSLAFGPGQCTTLVPGDIERHLVAFIRAHLMFAAHIRTVQTFGG